MFALFFLGLVLSLVVIAIRLLGLVFGSKEKANADTEEFDDISLSIAGGVFVRDTCPVCQKNQQFFISESFARRSVLGYATPRDISCFYCCAIVTEQMADTPEAKWLFEKVAAQKKMEEKALEHNKKILAQRNGSKTKE